MQTSDPRFVEILLSKTAKLLQQNRVAYVQLGWPKAAPPVKRMRISEQVPTNIHSPEIGFVEEKTETSSTYKLLIKRC